jgi:putative oxidoreductase
LDKKFHAIVITGPNPNSLKREQIKMSTAANPIERLYAVFLRVMNSLQSPLLLVIRVYWGWQLSQNGWGKLHNLPHVTEFFQSLGLPAPAFTATFVSSFEFVAGILLAIGLLSRIAALGIFIDMTTAYITSDRPAFTSFFSDPNAFAAAAPFIFWFVALLILILGPGKFALDTLIARARHKNEFANT